MDGDSSRSHTRIGFLTLAALALPVLCALVRAPLAHAAPLAAEQGGPHPLSSGDYFLLTGLGLALVVAALSAAAETALTSVNRIKIRNLAEEGDAKAQRIEHLLQRPQLFITTILIMSNLSVITASTLATIIAVDADFSGAEVISTVLLSIIVLIFCEITPKTAAVQSPERWSRALVGPVEALLVVMRPVVYALTTITAGILRLFGLREARHGPFVTQDELRLLVEVGEEEGVLEEEEREMIDNVFELADTQVREVMVPRIDMVTVEADDAIDDAVQLVLQGGQSRIPVYDGTIDNIIGVVYAKDLLGVLARMAKGEPVHVSIRDLVRPAYFVPESKRADDLLRELQQQRVHMAIALDEYGQVAGLVTIEDLVEEIIGDIQDEYDREEVLYDQVGPDEWIVDAKLSTDEFDELLEREIPKDGYDTLGGFVYSQLDKIPTIGDTVRFADVAITVLNTKGRRVTKVRVVRGVPTGDGSKGEQGTDDAASVESAAEAATAEATPAAHAAESGANGATPPAEPAAPMAVAESDGTPPPVEPDGDDTTGAATDRADIAPDNPADTGTRRAIRPAVNTQGRGASPHRPRRR